MILSSKRSFSRVKALVSSINTIFMYREILQTPYNTTIALVTSKLLLTILYLELELFLQRLVHLSLLGMHKARLDLQPEKLPGTAQMLLKRLVS